MDDKTKKIVGLSLLLTTTTMIGALLTNPIKESTKILAINNKQTYSFVKTDFFLSEAPIIPSDDRKSHGYSPMAFTEESGIFVSDVGDPTDINETTTGIGWLTGDNNGCKVTSEGNFFSLETVIPSPYTKPVDANREFGVNIKIDVLGDREILLTDNTYYLFDLYYIPQDFEDVILKREMKFTPEYYYSDHSSVFFSLDTSNSEYSWETEGYGKIEYYGVYKVTLKAISIEYSCSK